MNMVRLCSNIVRGMLNSSKYFLSSLQKVFKFAPSFWDNPAQATSSISIVLIFSIEMLNAVSELDHLPFLGFKIPQQVPSIVI